MTIRFLKITGVTMLVAFVSACSFKSVYNRLDYLIPEYIEGMVTLDDGLEHKLEQRTRVLLGWHRNTQLLPYADWMLSIQRDAGRGLTEATVRQRIAEVEQFWKILSGKINDEMALLLPLLDEEQQAELFLNIEDRNEEFRDEFVDLEDDERIDDYVERLTDTYENWIGELTAEQLLAVEQASSGLRSTADLRLQRRIEWQKGIQAILAGQHSAADKTQRLRLFMAGFEEVNNAEMQAKSEFNRGVITRLTVEISRGMTEEQKTYFTEKTNDYIRMLTELAENR
jgi:hypothetical protein